MILPNARYERFALAVAAGKVPSRAYEEAGFGNAPGKGYLQSCRLMKRPEVKERIAELRREAEAECPLERQELLEFLADVVETGADRVREVDRLCQGYRITEQARSVTMPDKLRAVDLLVKMCGWERPLAKEEPGREMKIVIGGNGA